MGEPRISNGELRELVALTGYPEWKTLIRWLEEERGKLADKVDRVAGRDANERNELVGERIFARRVQNLKDEFRSELKDRKLSIDNS